MKVGKRNKTGVVIAGRKHNLRGFDDVNPTQRYPQACNANVAGVFICNRIKLDDIDKERCLIMQQFLLKGENVLWKKNLQR